MNEEPRGYEFGPFRMFAAERLLMRDAIVIPLTPKAADTLLYLLENQGRLIEKDELIKAVWGADTFIEEGGLARNISVLRRVLDDDTGDPKFIATVPRRGYRFIAPVRQAHVVAPVPTSSAQDPQRTAPSPLSRRTFAAGLAGIGLLGWLGYNRPWNRPGSSGIRSIVVLPFETIASDGSKDFIAAGITEALLTRLTRIRALKVVSYHQSRGPVDPAGTAAKLKVDASLTGAVAISGDRLRINAHLIRSSSGEVLWGNDYERPLSGILAMERDVAVAIAREVQVQMTPQEQTRLASSGPVDPEASLLYMRGRYLWNRRTGPVFQKAMEFFRQAIEKDPSYALAHSGLADAYAVLGRAPYDALPPHEAMPKAREVAKRAIQMDDSLAEAYTTLAYVKFAYEWNFPDAEQLFLKALDRNPGYATALQWYAHLLMAMDRPEEALARLHRALELDPLSSSLGAGLARCHYYLRQYDEAIRIYRGILEMDPSNFIVAFGLAYTMIEKRAYPEATAAFGELATAIAGRTLAPDAMLGYTYAVSGRRDEAVKVIAKLKKAQSTRYVPAFYLAGICAALGLNKDAGEQGRKAFEERYEYLVYLRLDPKFDSLRAQPEIAALLHRHKLDGALSR